jgi:CheY-like chemotaxis protein
VGAMMQGQILVVDDFPDVCLTICGILEDAGYTAMSASSLQEALQRLEVERFHAAVLDVRLDDSNEDNQEGLTLMHEIAEKYPSMAIIVLTGYPTVERIREALQQNRQGVAPAFDFLQKSELSKLPDSVQRAFKYKIGINETLMIEDPQDCIEQLAAIIRFRTIPSPPKINLVEEIQELFRRLFFGCDKIQLLALQQGFSGSAVFRVEPVYKEKGRGESLVVKIGDAKSIKAEEKNYKEIVEGVIGGHRFPKAISVIYSKWLAGILYTFVGLGDIENFVEFYEKSSTEEIIEAIDNLYLETCFPWRHETGKYRAYLNLREFYVNHLRLYPKKLNSIKESYLGKEHTLPDDKTGKLVQVGRYTIEDPVSFAFAGDFHCNSFFSTIHGDITGENLLVDHHRETWLIDFASTVGEGHILLDYISLETYIRLLMIRPDDLDLIYKWERIIYQGNLTDFILPEGISSNSEIEKATEVIKRIRTLAGKTKHFSIRAYLIGLFFSSLRTITFLDLPKATRDHAFLSSALIAERFKRGNAYV